MSCEIIGNGFPIDGSRLALQPGRNENCTGWNPQQVGTLDYHDHIILAGLDTWTADGSSRVDQAYELFARSPLADGGYPALPPQTTTSVRKYYEANILGNPGYPDGVRFLVAVFSEHFGAATGERLQELASKHNWPLVWALGNGGSGGGGRRRRKVNATAEPAGSYPGNQRALDATVTAASTLNTTFPDGAAGTQANLWQTVASARQGTQPSAQQLSAWWEQFKASTINVGPSTARGCEIPDACVGIDINTNDCIC